jgi:hypothetical protein
MGRVLQRGGWERGGLRCVLLLVDDTHRMVHRGILKIVRHGLGFRVLYRVIETRGVLVRCLRWVDGSSLGQVRKMLLLWRGQLLSEVVGRMRRLIWGSD